MLYGKNIVITGCNRGIGLSVLRLFAQNRANIWACMRTMHDETKNELEEISNQYHVKITPIIFDLKDTENVKEAADIILHEKIPVDGIVNNAGIVGSNRLFTMTSMEEIREVFEVNFFAPMYFTQRLLKNMIRNKNGSIVNVSSAAAIDGEPAQFEYVTSKAALIGATKKLSIELGRYGIRVNAIAPGITDTDMIQNMQKELLDKSISRTALHRLGYSNDIAEAILFLISDKSSYVTGQVIRVDGGIW